MWAWLKRAFAGGLCVPDQSQNVTLTPPGPRGSDASSGSSAQQLQEDRACQQSFRGASAQQDEAADHTPLPLAQKRSISEGFVSSNPAASACDTHAEEDQTPPLQVVSADRYIVSGGMPVGIANTVSKYHESQPLVPHLTPFEQRVAAKLTEEQRVAAAAAAAAAASDDGDDGSSDGHADGHVKQRLFSAAVATGHGSSVA